MAGRTLTSTGTTTPAAPEVLVTSLQELRAAYRAGELTEAEFSRERLLLLDRRRAKLAWEGEDRRARRR